jgi:hypothetical protein
VVALVIFSVIKVFSVYPFTLPSYIAFYIIILTLFIFFFSLARTYLEYHALQLLQDAGFLRDYLEQYLKDTKSADESIIAVKGEVRYVIALTIILILGIALFQLMVTTGFDDFTKSILAVFAGAITSIIGFYFGAEVSKEGARITQGPKELATPSGTTMHITLKVTRTPNDSKVTGSGTLQTSDGTKLLNEKVEIQKSEDNKTWETLAFTLTEAEGAYSLGLGTFPAGTHFRAHFSGTKELMETFSPSTMAE